MPIGTYTLHLDDGTGQFLSIPVAQITLSSPMDAHRDPASNFPGKL